MEEEMEDIRTQFTSDGKRIIANITVDNEVYYMDEDKRVYERIGNVYIEVQNEEIIERVKAVLTKPSDDFFID